MRTLDQLDAKLEKRTPITALPVNLSRPGSYYVVTNLTAAASSGITISTNNVTVDLNGFTLFGPASGTSESAVTVTGTRTNITIRNGFFSGWPGSGIGGSALHLCLIEDIGIENVGRTGMFVGDGAVVRGCRIVGIGLTTANQSAIHVGDGAVISDCTISGQHGTAISGDARDIIQRCTVIGGLSTNDYAITVNSYSLIRDCVVMNNRGGTNHGGIFAGSHSTVKNCVVGQNTGHGISASDDTYLLEKNCENNDGDGINVSGENARVDLNHLAGNTGYGLRVTTTNGANLIIRNSSLSNPGSHYSIAPGNKDAALFFPGPGFSSTSPWVNFAF